VSLAKKKGAKIAKSTVINKKLAQRSNSNLIIGDNCSIQSHDLDLRSKIKIGNNVIIGSNVKIITASHNIHSTLWEVKYYGLDISDFVWLATDVSILPSCREIKYGTVCGAGSVVVKNTEEMSIVSGNPAIKIGSRQKVHSDLVVESMLSVDLIKYVEIYTKSKRKK
jgi:maltose O-acetyltransferase